MYIEVQVEHVLTCLVAWSPVQGLLGELGTRSYAEVGRTMCRHPLWTDRMTDTHD